MAQERKLPTMIDELSEDSISDISATSEETDVKQPGWLKLGAVAALSGLIGGLAAAWFYRKTLVRLRQAEAEESVRGPEVSNPDRDYDT